MRRLMPFVLLSLASCDAKAPSPSTAPVPRGPGKLTVTVATQVAKSIGVDQFGVTIDNQPARPIPMNGSISIDSIDSGDHYVSLDTSVGICFVGSADGFPRGNLVKVTVGPGSTAQVRFDVFCIA